MEERQGRALAHVNGRSPAVRFHHAHAFEERARDQLRLQERPPMHRDAGASQAQVARIKQQQPIIREQLCKTAGESLHPSCVRPVMSSQES